MKMEAMEIRSSDDFDTNESPYCPLIRSCYKYYMIAMLLAAFGAAVLYSCAKALRRNAVSGDELLKSLDDVNLKVFAPELVLPPELVNSGKYSGGDFENALGITPPFWGENETCIYGKCQKLWGPCFAEARPIWEKETIYHETPLSGSKMPDPDDLSGYCRPGFLIIGQGKCGTSSLYHYLNGHPRVLPAKEKQIHYFKVRYPANSPCCCSRYYDKLNPWPFTHINSSTSHDTQSNGIFPTSHPRGHFLAKVRL
jgi:hypothetical protein